MGQEKEWGHVVEQKILELIKKEELIRPKERVLIAVSGGPDSLALLHWLVGIREEWQLNLLAVHLNHQFRGEEADQDEAFVQEICQAWELPCLSKRMDVASFARKRQLGNQEAARICRYQFFEEVAKEYGYPKVALAHHADDQLETVLMRLIRGTGLKGLSGIPILRETEHYTIIRPFLAVTKQEIEDYCKRHQLEPRIDPSNQSDHYTRNYIRHHLIPHIVHLNTNVHQIVTEMTETLRLENEYIESESRRYLSTVLRSQSEDKIAICLSSFLKVPLPLQRRLILLLLSYLPISRSFWNKVHIEAIFNLFHSTNGYKRLHLPEAILVTKEYNHVQISKLDSSEDKKHRDYLEELPACGEYRLTSPSLLVQISIWDRKDVTQAATSFMDEEDKQIHVAWFDAEQLHLPIILRNRRPGDKIQPLGMEGHKKVKDIFIDEKIPHAARQIWPIFTQGDQLIWIPGLKRSNRAKVTKETEKLLKVEIEMFEEDLLRAR